MTSNEGTRGRVVLLLLLAAVATIAGFWQLLDGSTGVGGALVLIGALGSGAALLDMRRS